jgi:gamma-glutamylcyclotransferase (GGCT)/AIG2-like uncharacterized protein YtfP
MAEAQAKPVTHLYFAYGSNMARLQMKRLCPGAKFASRGILRDHQLAFTRPGGEFGGGIADLKPVKGRVVEGVLWEVTEAHLKALDEYEEVPRAYVRKSVTLEKPDGTPVTAFAYFAIPVGNYAPSRRYMRLVIQGAEEHNLSDPYVAFLESIRTRG